MKPLTETVARLDDDAQVKFDKFLRKTKIARDGSKAGAEAKTLKEEIVLAMGESVIAQLPDGRRIQKVQKHAHRNPMPARDDAWWELSELPAAA